MEDNKDMEGEKGKLKGGEQQKSKEDNSSHGPSRQTDRAFSSEHFLKEAQQPGGGENAAGVNQQAEENIDREQRGSKPIPTDLLDRGEKESTIQE